MYLVFGGRSQAHWCQFFSGNKRTTKATSARSLQTPQHVSGGELHLDEIQRNNWVLNSWIRQSSLLQHFNLNRYLMLWISSSHLKYRLPPSIFPIPRARHLKFRFVGSNKKRKSGRFFSRSMLMRIRPKQFVFPRNYKLKKLKEAFLFYSCLTFVVYFSPVLFPFQLENFCLLGAVHTWRPYILLESIYIYIQTSEPSSLPWLTDASPRTARWARPSIGRT